MNQQQKMVKVFVEVRSGTARFSVGVQAQSIREALSVVEGRYPQGKIRVASPRAPEGIFVLEPLTLRRMVGTEQYHTKAA